ncbi:hypothetical protein niasHT_001707 [Heterodera trifolii]|uniref:Isopropylmalate dehydrogenase-like domain-containing protein n=1 Tax=Heterodera trifolii TaxID=157864 RepID=A0ABD2MEW1_9BILA
MSVVAAFSRRIFFPLIKSSRSLSTISPAIAVPEIAKKLKCTLIPGDGVGPELVYAVQDIVKATGIPIEFEEVFLSEVYYSRSASIEDVVESIARNNCVALKGAIQSSLDDKTDGLNTQLRKRLDLFANVVHIKALEGIRTRHKNVGLCHHS